MNSNDQARETQGELTDASDGIVWVVLSHGVNGVFVSAVKTTKAAALRWAEENEVRPAQPEEQWNADVDWQDDPDAADGLAWNSDDGDTTVTVTPCQVTE